MMGVLSGADLRRLKSKVDTTGWNSLTKDEQSRYQAFLLDLKEGDWVIYVNVPQWADARPHRLRDHATGNRKITT
jgi:hypothetical protein